MIRVRKGFLAVFIFFVLASLTPSLLSLWVYHEIPKRIDLEIRGRFGPAWFLPSFSLKDVRARWSDKIEVVSGDLRVEYDAWRFLRTGEIRVKIFGEKVPVKLAESLRVLGNSETVVFEKISADLVLGRKGVREIISLRADSPGIQFRLGLAEK